MGCRCKWTTLCSIIFILFLNNTAVCHKNGVGGRKNCNPTESNNEWNLDNNVSPKSQLMNTLLTMAAANGLTDLSSVIQPSPPNDVPCQTLNDIPQSLSLIQLAANPPHRPQEHLVVTGKPAFPISQPVLASPFSGLSTQQPCLPSQYTFLPTSQSYPVQHAIRLENNPINYPSVGVVQPIPAVWQSQPVITEMSRETPCKPAISSFSFDSKENSDSSSNEDITPTIVDRTPNEVFENNPSLPINLQINLPAQSAPEPKITVVSAAPSAANRGPLSMPPYFPPPIIIDGSDSMNSWLPMMLIALMANDRGNCGPGCACNCCCPCGNSEQTIPIPYPIPIPVNSPVIFRSSDSKTKPNTDKMHKPKKKEDGSEENHKDEHEKDGDE